MTIHKLPDFDDLLVRMTNHAETTAFDVETPCDVEDPDPCPPDMNDSDDEEDSDAA